MAERRDIYECTLCGNIIEVLHGGDGELVCCDEPMKKLVAKKADVGREKHVPVIEKADGVITVKIGSILHPMEEKHYIDWVELIADGKSYRQYLKPGDKPEAVFAINAQQISAREYCTIHSLWES